MGHTDPPAQRKLTDSQNSGNDAILITDKEAASSSSDESLNTQMTPNALGNVIAEVNVLKSPKNLTEYANASAPNSKHDAQDPGYVSKAVDLDDLTTDSDGRNNGGYQSGPENINHRGLQHDLTRKTLEEKVDDRESQKNPKNNDFRDRSLVANASPNQKYSEHNFFYHFNSVSTNDSDKLQKTLNSNSSKTETKNMKSKDKKSYQHSENSLASFGSSDNQKATSHTSSDKTKVEIAASQSTSEQKTYSKVVEAGNVRGNTGQANLQQPVAAYFAENGDNHVRLRSSVLHQPVVRQIQPVELYEWPTISLSKPGRPPSIKSHISFSNKERPIGSRHPSVFVPRQSKNSTGSQADTLKDKMEIEQDVMFPENHSEHKIFLSNDTEKNQYSASDNSYSDITYTETKRSDSKINGSGDEIDHDSNSKSSDSLTSRASETQNSLKSINFYQMTPVEHQVAQKDKKQREKTSSSSYANFADVVDLDTADDYHREGQNTTSTNESSLGDRGRNSNGNLFDSIRSIFSGNDTTSNSKNSSKALSISLLPLATKQDLQPPSESTQHSQIPIPTKFNAKVPFRNNASAEISANKDSVSYDDDGQSGQRGIDKKAIMPTSKNSHLVQESNISRSGTVGHSPNHSVEGVSVADITKPDSQLQEADAQISGEYDHGNSVVRSFDLKDDNRKTPRLQQDLQAPYPDRSRYYRYTVPYYSLVKRKGQLIAKRTNVLPIRSSQRPSKKMTVLSNSGMSTREQNNNNYSHFKKQIRDNSRVTPEIQASYESYPALKAYSLVHDIVKSSKSDDRETGRNHPKKNVNTHKSTLKPNIWYDRVLGLRLGGSHPSLTSRHSPKGRQKPAKHHPDKLPQPSTQSLADPTSKSFQSRTDKAKHNKVPNVRQNSQSIFSRDSQSPIKTTNILDTSSRTNIPPSNKVQGIHSKPKQSYSNMQSFSQIHINRGLLPGRNFPVEKENPLDLKLSKTTRSEVKSKDTLESVRPLETLKSKYHSMTTAKVPNQHIEHVHRKDLSNIIDPKTDDSPDTRKVRNLHNEDSTGENMNDADANNTLTSKADRIHIEEKRTPEVTETSMKAGREMTSQTMQGNAHLKLDRETSSPVPASLPSTSEHKPSVVSQRSVNSPRSIVFNENVRSPASVHGEGSRLQPKAFYSLGFIHPDGKNLNSGERVRIDPSRPKVDANFKNGRFRQLSPQLNPVPRRPRPDTQKQDGITVRSNKSPPPIPPPLYKNSGVINKIRGGNELSSIRPVLYNKNPNKNNAQEISSKQVHFHSRENNHENNTIVNKSNSSSYESAVQAYLSALADTYNQYPGYNTPPFPFHPLYPYVNPYAYTNPYMYPIAPPNPYVISGFPSAYSQSPYRGAPLLHSILNTGTSLRDGKSPVNQNARPSRLSKQRTSSTDSNSNRPNSDRHYRGSTRNTPSVKTSQVRPSLLSMPSTKFASNENKASKLRQQPEVKSPDNYQAKRQWHQTTQKYPANNYQPSVNYNSKTSNSDGKNLDSLQPIVQPQPAYPAPNGWLPVFPPLFIVDPRPLYGPAINYGQIPSLYSSQIHQVPATHHIDERDLKAIEHFLLTKRGYNSWFGSNSNAGYYTNTKTNPRVQQGTSNGHLTDMDMKAIEHFIYTNPYYRRGNGGGGLGSLKLLTLLG